MKINFAKIGFILGLSLLSASAFATATSEFTQRLNNLGTLQAHFTQKVTNPNGKILQESHGSIAIERPGKFRWESMTPMHQLIIADGQNMWIYDVDLKQVTVKYLRNANGDNPALFLSGFSSKVAHYFSVEQEGEAFKLTPKGKNSDFQQIEFDFQGDALLRMQLTDSLGQRSDVQLSGVKMNQSVPRSAFIMRVPNGVDVIRPKS